MPALFRSCAKAYAKRLNRYLMHLDRLLWPDLIILGGGVSKEWPKWGRLIKTRAELVTARFLNTSGIIGAAWAAAAIGGSGLAGPGDRLAAGFVVDSRPDADAGPDASASVPAAEG